MLNTILQIHNNNIFNLDLSNNGLSREDIVNIFDKFRGFKKGGIIFGNNFESLNLSNNENLIQDYYLSLYLSQMIDSQKIVKININKSFNTKKIIPIILLKQFPANKFDLITSEKISAFTNTSMISLDNYMYLIYGLIFLLILYYILKRN